MSLLPTEQVKAPEKLEPSKLLIYGQSKVGKTTALSMLPNNLIIDFESGTSYLDGGYVIDVNKAVKEGEGQTPLNIVRQLHAELGTKEHNFKFITFDTADWLEQYMGEEVAKMAGEKHYTDIEYGKGYALVRDRIIDMVSAFEQIGLNIIIIAHRKKTTTGESGKEVEVRDVDLTGKLKNFMFSWADAIGYMHRMKEEDDAFLSTALSFKTDVLESLEGGCRIRDLQNQTVRLVTYNYAKSKFVYNNWKEIYPITLNGNGKENK